ncbi:MAG TPA: hypothetical protein K8W21_06435 [Enorma massiliensis]|uniref:transglutaminase domain-containing protein n=1 Tax=Enorma massiliensis TaxID=1472761 RepID=UPI001D51F4F5|nr:transglutaminase domain-containing protein [Enorma massiliensis]HJG62597.1 hypothetical protein [Enorma massiliensis]
MATYEFSAESIKKMLGRVVRATDAAVRGAADAVRKLETDDQRAEQDATARIGGARVGSALRAGGAAHAGGATHAGGAAASAENVVAHAGGATRAGSAAASSAHGDGATARSVRGGAAAARVTASAVAPKAAVPAKPAPAPVSVATQVPAAATGPVAPPAVSGKATTSAPAPCDLAAYVHPGSCTFEQDRLSGAARRAYQAMLDGMLAYREHIKLFGVTEAEVGEAYEAVRRGTPEAFWIDGYFLRCASFEGRIWEVSPRYRLAREDAARMLAEMEERTRPLLEALAALPSLEQRVQAAHNALILNVGYSDTDDPLESTAAGALVEGRALCGGFALAFKYLMDRLEVPCIVMRGTAASTAERNDVELHAWNLVQLDGRWTHVDVTYDLAATVDKRHPHLAYLGTSDEEIARTHDWERDAFPAAPLSLECYRRRGRYVREWDELAGLFDLMLARDGWCSFQLDERLTRSGIEPGEPIDPEKLVEKIYDLAATALAGAFTTPRTLSVSRDDVMRAYEVTVR